LADRTPGTSPSVVIVGGGIAGLTAGLALARHGLPSILIEQAEAFSEIGAGLQLSPNATRLLERLGIGAELRDRWHEPLRLDLRSGRDLQPLAHLSLGASAVRRWHSPYAVIHRADLIDVLAKALQDTGLCRIVAATRFRHSDQGLAKLESLAGQPADLVIGADGVWSQVRRAISPAADARFTGRVAWRLAVERAALAALGIDPDRLTAFFGPQSHLVAYPLPRRSSVNLVAIADGRERSRDWSNAAGSAIDRDVLLKTFARWSPALRSLLADASQPTSWPIYEHGQDVFGDGDRVALIGDAAHAMAPYAAQGAAMAIEDAFLLADLIASPGSHAAEALSRYGATRAPRIGQVRRRAAFNRFAYHAKGPVRLARDLVLSLRSPESLAADFDWLYAGP
jgi:salicylate hydroxylase